MRLARNIKTPYACSVRLTQPTVEILLDALIGNARTMSRWTVREGLARGATFASVQPLLAYAAANLDDDVSLTALAGKAGLSAFYLHRVFLAAVGETPKQFTMRLRLGHAAARLLMTDDSVLNVALSCGFQSHEVFIRGFGDRSA